MLLSLIKQLLVFSYFHSGGDQHTTGFMLLVGARRIIASSSSSVVATRTRTTMMTTTSATGTGSSSSKILHVVRHGESFHNPRAEAAKSNGCSMEEFFDLMRQDDAWDADLTDLGRRQAKQCRDDHFSVRDDNNNIANNNSNRLGIDLVIGSSLSRTMDTADLVFPPHNNNINNIKDEQIPRISLEYFREVNGHFLNGKRRNKKELNSKFPHWNFDSLTTEEDESWTPDIEKYEDVAERGYLGLVALLTGRYNNNDDDDNESKSKSIPSNENYNNILLVCHGGILRYVMTIHPLVHLRDERTKNTSSDNNKSVESRFDNCEFRKYRLSWKEDHDLDDDAEKKFEDDRHGTTRRAIVLTQLDH
jgi:broad specificity phosphatase PhoE